MHTTFGKPCVRAGKVDRIAKGTYVGVQERTLAQGRMIGIGGGSTRGTSRPNDRTRIFGYHDSASECRSSIGDGMLGASAPGLRAVCPS